MSRDQPKLAWLQPAVDSVQYTTRELQNSYINKSICIQFLFGPRWLSKIISGNESLLGGLIGKYLVNFADRGVCINILMRSLSPAVLWLETN